LRGIRSIGRCAVPDKNNKALGDDAYDTLAAYKKSINSDIELVALPRDNRVVEKNAKDLHVIKRKEKTDIDKQDKWLKLNEYAQYYSANIVVIRTMNKIMDEFLSLFR
jgi:hypothetical protein